MRGNKRKEARGKKRGEEIKKEGMKERKKMEKEKEKDGEREKRIKREETSITRWKTRGLIKRLAARERDAKTSAG